MTPNTETVEAPKTDQVESKVYTNEKPVVPAETSDVKYEVREVSRKIKTVTGEEVRAMFVLAPVAKTIEGALEVAKGKLEDLLSSFNDGVYAKIRANASNELQGGSAEDKAFAKMVKAVKNLPLFAGKSEDEISETLRTNPAIAALLGVK